MVEKENGKKAKRLDLKPNNEGLFVCPVSNCDHDGFSSQRGCRKHVFERHGWFFFFDEQPDVTEYFPELVLKSGEFNEFLKRLKDINTI